MLGGVLEDVLLHAVLAQVAAWRDQARMELLDVGVRQAGSRHRRRGEDLFRQCSRLDDPVVAGLSGHLRADPDQHVERAAGGEALGDPPGDREPAFATEVVRQIPGENEIEPFAGVEREQVGEAALPQRGNRVARLLLVDRAVEVGDPQTDAERVEEVDVRGQRAPQVEHRGARARQVLDRRLQPRRWMLGSQPTLLPPALPVGAGITACVPAFGAASVAVASGRDRPPATASRAPCRSSP